MYYLNASTYQDHLHLVYYAIELDLCPSSHHLIILSLILFLRFAIFCLWYFDYCYIATVYACACGVVHYSLVCTTCGLGMLNKNLRL
jgi:hypothetical protein